MLNIKSKNNDIWDLYQIDLNDNTIYNIFTKKGNYRWWKSYSEDKKVIIVSWTLEFISANWDNDNRVIHKAWDNFIIPAWLNHIFYFTEDCEMIEVFPRGTKTEKFNRYYDLKN